MFPNATNSKKQGDMGLGIAIAWFVTRGTVVSVPLTDSQDYDLVVDVEGLKKVQVKTTSYMVDGTYVVELRTKGGNKTGTGKTKKFNREKVDFLFVLTDSNLKYLIPSQDVGGETGISLTSKYDRFIV